MFSSWWVFLVGCACLAEDELCVFSYASLQGFVGKNLSTSKLLGYINQWILEWVVRLGTTWFLIKISNGCITTDLKDF